MRVSRSQPFPPAPGQDFLALVNPPLVVSAAAEALAAALIGDAPLREPKALVLAAASGLLFGAGAIFGHYFDRTADAARDPERPLTSGRVEPQRAWSLGWVLLLSGAALAAAAGRGSLVVATGLALVIVLYAAVTKGIWGAGFLTLGAARGLNVLLGLTAADLNADRYWALALVAIPVMLYTVGWAVLRGTRQRGAPPSSGLVGLLHIVAGVSALLYQAVTQFSYRGDATPFLVLFLALAFPRFVTAVADPRRPQVLEAVQYGFLCLTLLEATLAAGYAGAAAGLLPALACIPLYRALKKWPVSLVLE